MPRSRTKAAAALEVLCASGASEGWTAETVCRAMVLAYKAEHLGSHFRNLIAEHLAAFPDERITLHTWAWCTGTGEISFRKLCKARGDGWGRGRRLRLKDRACELMAERLNEAACCASKAA